MTTKNKQTWQESLREALSGNYANDGGALATKYLHLAEDIVATLITEARKEGEERMLERAKRHWEQNGGSTLLGFIRQNDDL